ncbi:MAG: hypothetical protein WAK96_06640 [Desulfobaccales bacterium]
MIANMGKTSSLQERNGDRGGIEKGKGKKSKGKNLTFLLLTFALIRLMVLIYGFPFNPKPETGNRP